MVKRKYLTGGGETGSLIRSYDWSKTPLGSIDTWPQTLLTSVDMLLMSSIPMFMWWGKDDAIYFYNDAHREILGNKHPEALGKRADEIWKEIWNDLKPLVNTVFNDKQPVFKKDLPLQLNRFGHSEETYFTFLYSPIFGNAGKVDGLYCVVTETTEEVLSRQKLEESEARFQNLADTAPMYIAVADEQGKAVYFNKPWLDFTGMKLDDMKGMGWLATLHPDDAPRFEKGFLNAFKQRVAISEEYRFRRADGEYRWMYAVGAPRYTIDKRFIGYFGTYTDFHETKQAQLSLEQSEIRFRTLIEKSVDAVQLVSPDGKILYSSDSVKNVLGYTPEEIAHDGVLPYIHPEDRKYFLGRFQHLVDDPGGQILIQYRVKHKDGSWAWLETIGVNHMATPGINALVGNFRNITAQKKAEEKVQKSEAKFRALAENIPNLTWMARPDGHIYWYNERWYQYTGTTPGEMEGWGWKKVHDPSVLPNVIKKWRHSINSGKAFEMVFPIRGSDGQFRPFLTRVAPLLSGDGTVDGWVGTNTDISEQLRTKQAVAKTKQLEDITSQLIVQRKELLELNIAKDEFISLASHQLRTPATGVKQYLGMLLDGYAEELTDRQKEFAKRAYDSNERELSIVNDLLRVAQVDAGKIRIEKSKIDLVELIGEIILEQSEKFQSRDQKVIFKHDEPSYMTRIDKVWMRMAIENLIDNASKYSQPGKKITITISRHGTDVKINISDQGVGFDKANADKIFDKFVRVDNPLSTQMGGNGLGLYLVKRIIELHNGKIKASSKVDKGSKFSVILRT